MGKLLNSYCIYLKWKGTKQYFQRDPSFKNRKVDFWGRVYCIREIPRELGSLKQTTMESNRSQLLGTNQHGPFPNHMVVYSIILLTISNSLSHTISPCFPEANLHPGGLFVVINKPSPHINKKKFFHNQKK